MDQSFCEKGTLMLFRKMELREDMGSTQNVYCISAVDYGITHRCDTDKCDKIAEIHG